MNIDNKYNNYLTDLISLLQEALFRTFAKKPVDQHKFAYYFQHIYTHMAQLEHSFTTQTLKITKLLQKLHHFTNQQQHPPATQTQHENHFHQIELQRPKHKQPAQSSDRPIERPAVKQHHGNKSSNHSKELNSKELKSIQELEEEEYQFMENKGGKRRSQTANGYRQTKMDNSRPFTGKRNNNRYKSINVQPPINLLTEQNSQISFANSNAYRDSSKEDRQRVRSKLQVRKSFYDELMKQKDAFDVSGSGVMGGNTISYSVGLRKGYSKSQRKWAHKISRLL